MGNRIFNFTLVVVVLGTAGLLVFQWQEKTQANDALRQDSTATNIGISYLPVTAKISEYYNLGVDTGALVTEVVPNSVAEQAGVRLGDVIIAFNGNSLKEMALFRLMADCADSEEINLEICRDNEIKQIVLERVIRQPGKGLDTR